MASHWQRDQPRERHGHGGGGRFQNPMDQRQNDFGLHFQTPWGQHSRDQRSPVHHDDTNYNYNPPYSSSVDPNDEIVVKIPVASWKELQYPSGELGAIPKRPEVIDDEKQREYLTKILKSKVYDVISESPFHLAPNLSKGLGFNLWLKREDSNPAFSFKLRGAYNMMSNLPKEALEKGVICASTGNHAQGVAFSAEKLGTPSVIVMPRSTPPFKVEIVKNLGGDVVLYGDTFDDAQEYARQLSQARNLTIIPPFDNEDIIIGQGTVGMEIGRQMREPLHGIFVPVGGGGLLAGIASFYKQIYPEVKIIGVEPNDANSMALALHKDQVVRLANVGSFADGVDVKQVGESNFRICKQLVDGIVLVNKHDMADAIKEMYEETRTMLEPAGALAIAGAKAYCKYNKIKGVNVVAITSGANTNFDQMGRIADYANYANQTEATFAIKIPEKPGSLKSTLSDLVGSRKITELKYRYNSEKEAIVLFGVGVNGASDLGDVKIKIESSPFETYDLTNNEFVRDHLRYMMGGRSKVPNEALYRFSFPDLEGALLLNLDIIGASTDISLLHYRQQGTASGEALVGIKIDGSKIDEFNESLKKHGIDYSLIDKNDPAFKLIMSD